MSVTNIAEGQRLHFGCGIHASRCLACAQGCHKRLDTCGEQLEVLEICLEIQHAGHVVYTDIRRQHAEALCGQLGSNQWVFRLNTKNLYLLVIFATLTCFTSSTRIHFRNHVFIYVLCSLLERAVVKTMTCDSPLGRFTLAGSRGP